jgi:hypothetical protein
MTICDKFVKFGSPQTSDRASLGNRATERLREWNGQSSHGIRKLSSLNDVTLLLPTAPHRSSTVTKTRARDLILPDCESIGAAGYVGVRSATPANKRGVPDTNGETDFFWSATSSRLQLK